MVSVTFRKAEWPVYTSLAAAIALGLYDFGHRFAELIPNFVLLVLVYWAIYRPDVIGLGRAWMVGLAQDFLTVSLIGQHAMTYVLVVYVIKSGKFRVNQESFPGFVPWLAAFAGLDVLVRFSLAWLTGHSSPDWATIYPVIGCVLAWPWLYLALGLFENLVAQLRK